MDERLRQRLVGAAVLVSLAVIFIPMILDRRDREMGEVGSQLPPAPDFQPHETLRPLALPPPLPEAEAPATAPGPATGATPSTTAKAPPGPSAQVGKPTPPATGPKAAIVPSRTPTPSQPVPGKPARRASAPGAPGWYVQVGSFGKVHNAEALATRLKQAGFPASVSRVVQGGRVFYRVRVGPMADRARAEATKGRLDRLLGQHTLVRHEKGGAP
ncbi:MAG: sporulation protein [Gammaproteobacteria bacterium]|nr:MAG: sporulation protein [Gammaproteobacteria bacterium]